MLVSSQDHVATVASVTTVGASELLPGLTVEAARPVAATAPSDEHSAMVHKMFFQFFLGEQFLPRALLVLGAVCTAGREQPDLSPVPHAPKQGPRSY